MSRIDIDSFELADSGLIAYGTLNHRMSTSSAVSAIGSLLESVGWSVAGGLYAQATLNTTSIWRSIGGTHTKFATRGSPQCAYNGMLALAYDPATSYPDDALAAAAYPWAGGWVWVPLDTAGDTVAWFSAALTEIMSGFSLVAVRPLHPGYAFLMQADAPGPAMNDQELFGNGATCVPDRGFTWGGGWIYQSVANPTTGTVYRLHFAMSAERQLEVVFYDGGGAPKELHLLGIGNDFQETWWGAKAKNFVVYPRGDPGLTDPVHVIANPYQLVICDNGQREISENLHFLALNRSGGNSLLAASPWVPEHQRAELTECAFCIGPGALKTSTGWKLSSTSTVLTAIVNGASYSMTTEAYGPRVSGCLYPKTVNREVLLVPGDAPAQFNAWVNMPPSPGAESRIVGKLWDAFVQTKDPGCAAEIADGDKVYLCVTSDGAPRFTSRSSLFVRNT